MANTGHYFIVSAKIFPIVLAFAGDSTITKYLYAITEWTPFHCRVPTIKRGFIQIVANHIHSENVCQEKQMKSMVLFFKFCQDILTENVQTAPSWIK